MLCVKCIIRPFLSRHDSCSRKVWELQVKQANCSNFCQIQCVALHGEFLSEVHGTSVSYCSSTLGQKCLPELNSFDFEVSGSHLCAFSHLWVFSWVFVQDLPLLSCCICLEIQSPSLVTCRGKTSLHNIQIQKGEQ